MWRPWLDEEPEPPHPRRRKTDSWRYRLEVALMLVGTHAGAAYLGHTWHR